jgi:UDP-N-acetylglucosamine--N-acetylmuramyl-(pentapeptide) pyrophosphoryl-undecaprenol N-acetylglucosamine transferase
MDDEMLEPQKEGMRVLLAGGGTGGHVFPALAVARKLVGRGCVVSWVGRSEGMERTLVEEAGLEYHALSAKPWLGRGYVAKLSALMTLGWSAQQARRLVRQSGVSVTVGTGGYVSAPAIVGSYLARCPVVLLEPNASAGTANRWLSRLSTAACTGYEETGRELKCRTYWTGTPVRAEFLATGALPAGDPTVLVVGGSQGARQINQLVPPVLERLAPKMRGSRVIHQTGSQHLAGVEAEYRSREFEGVRLEVVPFIKDMAAAMSAAAIIISRAGALTLAEITAAGRPSILIPLAAAAGHQQANAATLGSGGAAEVVGPEQATVDHLEDLLGSLLADRSRRERMAAAARRLALVDAAERIADLIEVIGETA